MYKNYRSKNRQSSLDCQLPPCDARKKSFLADGLGGEELSQVGPDATGALRLVLLD